MSTQPACSFDSCVNIQSTMQRPCLAVPAIGHGSRHEESHRPSLYTHSNTSTASFSVHTTEPSCQPQNVFAYTPLPAISLDEKQGDEFPFPTVAPPPARDKSVAAARQARQRKLPPHLNLQVAHKTVSDLALPTPPLTLSPSGSSEASLATTPLDGIPAASHFPDLSRIFSDSDSISSGESHYESEDEEPPSLSDYDPVFEGETFSSKFLRKYKVLPQFLERYTVEFELGTGGFGFVVKGARRADGMPVAIKCIFKSLMVPHSLVYSPRWNGGHTQIPMEADVLMRLDHPGIIKFVDLMEDSRLFYFIMEHHGTQWTDRAQVQNPVNVESEDTASMFSPDRARPAPSTLHAPRPLIRRSSSDLFERIDTCDRFGEHEARYIFAQIVSIVSYLDRQRIYHMDIKDENIVVDDHLRVKLIDFGSAVDQSTLTPLTRFLGTYLYAPPEVIRRETFYAPETEVWSLGILFCILLAGASIFKGPKDIIANKYNRRAFSSMPAGCQQIIRLCLEQAPGDRISIQDLRRHPYLALDVQNYERAHLRTRRSFY